MTRLRTDITTSLDGFVAGPNATVDSPLGEGGDRLHAPLLLGDGVRLFDNLAGTDVRLEVARVIDSPSVTHLKYRVVN
jgi:hypothetical protein